jgi:hypothetical protein
MFEGPLAADPPRFRLTTSSKLGGGGKTTAMSEAFETAVAFARQLIDGRGKDWTWTKRARTLATAAYQVAQEEGKKGEPCDARALELLCAPEAVLLGKISIAVSVNMQAKLFNRLSQQQRSSMLMALNAAAGKRLDPGRGPAAGRARLASAHAPAVPSAQEGAQVYGAAMVAN